MGQTMPEKRNALAELAERLKSFVSENEMIFVDSDINALNRAQRIVAELAKVEWFVGVRDIPFPSMSDAMKCMNNCLAIAEEGANHGNK